MKTKSVSVAVLKQRLSEYLRIAERGDEVLVTSHHRSVARIVPENGTGLAVRPPTLPLSALGKLCAVRLAGATSAVQTLLNDRRRR